MRYAALWFGLFLFTLCVAVPAGLHAAEGCSTGAPSTGDCPILEEDGSGAPALIDAKFPDPIGTIQLPKKIYLFSGPICIVDTIIRNSIEGLYATFIGAFANPFKLVLMLYVIFYAIGFIFGLVNPKDFAVRAFKITVVWLLVSDNCFFYKYFYETFIELSNDFIMIISETDAEAAGAAPPADAQEARKHLYQNLDALFNNVVGMEGLVGLGVMLLTSLTSNNEGITSAAMIALGVGAMAMALLRALVTLAISLAGVAFFLLFTPIFLSFFMFQNTRQLFDNWLKILISFTLQPFIIFTFLILMKNVIDAAAPTVEIEHMVKDAVEVIENKELKPELATERPVVRVLKTNKEKLMAKGIAVGADKEFEYQEKFFTEFVSKLLFWFFTNMLMSAFMKEVPGIAQRLGGYISAPALGMTAKDGDGGFSAREGIVLPGVTKGAGGTTMNILNKAMRSNSLTRDTAIGTAGTLTAYALYEGAVERDKRSRDGANIENPMAIKGGAGRDGDRIMRASEILGDETVGRDGTRTGGIGSEKKANREGMRAEGIGEKNAARRVEMIRAEDVKSGTENINSLFGLGIASPELANENKESEKEKEKLKHKLLNTVTLKTQSSGKAIYDVNGKSVAVTKDEEAQFLQSKIKDIENDISKSKVLGGLSDEAYDQAVSMRKDLRERLREITKGGRGAKEAAAPAKGVSRAQSVKEMEKPGAITVEEVSKAAPGRAGEVAQEIEKLVAARMEEKPDMARLEELPPALVGPGEAVTIQKGIDRSEANAQSRNYAELIQEFEKLRENTGANTQRVETVDTILTPPLAENVLPQPIQITEAQLPGGMNMQQLAEALPDQIAVAPPAAAALAETLDSLMGTNRDDERTAAQEETRLQHLREFEEQKLAREQGEGADRILANALENAGMALPSPEPEILVSSLEKVLMPDEVAPMVPAEIAVPVQETPAPAAIPVPPTAAAAAAATGTLGEALDKLFGKIAGEKLSPHDQRLQDMRDQQLQELAEQKYALVRGTDETTETPAASRQGGANLAFTNAMENAGLIQPSPQPEIPTPNLEQGLMPDQVSPMIPAEEFVIPVQEPPVPAAAAPSTATPATAAKVTTFAEALDKLAAGNEKAVKETSPYEDLLAAQKEAIAQKTQDVETLPETDTPFARSYSTPLQTFAQESAIATEMPPEQIPAATQIPVTEESTIIAAQALAPETLLEQAPMQITIGEAQIPPVTIEPSQAVAQTLTEEIPVAPAAAAVTEEPASPMATAQEAPITETITETITIAAQVESVASSVPVSEEEPRVAVTTEQPLEQVAAPAPVFEEVATPALAATEVAPTIAEEAPIYAQESAPVFTAEQPLEQAAIQTPLSEETVAPVLAATEAAPTIAEEAPIYTQEPAPVLTTEQPLEQTVAPSPAFEETVMPASVAAEQAAETAMSPVSEIAAGRAEQEVVAAITGELGGAETAAPAMSSDLPPSSAQETFAPATETQIAAELTPQSAAVTEEAIPTPVVETTTIAAPETIPQTPIAEDQIPPISQTTQTQLAEEHEKILAQQEARKKAQAVAATPDWMAAMELGGMAGMINRELQGEGQATQEKEEQQRAEQTLNVHELLKANPALYSFITKLPEGTRNKIMDNMRKHHDQIRKGTPEKKQFAKKTADKMKEKKSQKSGGGGGGKPLIHQVYEDLAFGELRNAGIDNPELQVAELEQENPANPGGGES